MVEFLKCPSYWTKLLELLRLISSLLKKVKPLS